MAAHVSVTDHINTYGSGRVKITRASQYYCYTLTKLLYYLARQSRTGWRGLRGCIPSLDPASDAVLETSLGLEAP